jgi:chemotaxis protein methyltransferase CheR
MPQGILPRYFDETGAEIRVKDVLRRITLFQHHNLRETLPAGIFDIIFCRNVMIYFSREEQARLVQKFKERLAPEGFLFIGHSESLQGLGVDYRLRIHERGIAYQRPASDK